MSKINLTDATTLTNETSFVSALNTNFATIETASDNFLSLDGTSPNSMAANLDMNSYRIINLPEPVLSNDPVRLQDMVTFTGGGTIAAFPTTSAGLAAAITDETGTGSLVFGTSPTFTTGLTVPLIKGGTAAGSSLTLESTSGTGTTDSIIFKTGSQSTRWTMDTTGLLTGGTGTYSAAGSYTGGIASSNLSITRGTSASPVTDSFANAVFQSWGNQSTGSGTTLYSSWVKKSTAATGGRAVWAEAIDTVGGTGSYVEGLRSSATMNGGTLGNGLGIVGIGIASVAYSYVGGAEFQVYNLSGTAATTTFSSSKFSFGVLASCGQAAGAAADAGFMTNPLSNAPFISGFLVPALSVSDTAFRCDASTVNGIDLSRGTYSGNAFKGTGFTVDNAGNTTVNTLLRGAPVTKTNDFTVGTAENWLIINKAGSTTVTLPAAASFTGREIHFKTIQTQTAVSATSNVVPNTTASAGTALLPATDGAWCTIVSDGTNWIIMASSTLV